MDALADFQLLFAYGDEMNRRLLLAASALTPSQLNAAHDIGMGTLRKTLTHIVAGEQTWLERWKGDAEARWSDLSEADLDLLEDVCRTTVAAREQFLTRIDAASLDVDQPYRDSAGTLYRATLREQMLQGVVHSTHHRAQAVHLLKRASGTFVEVDFMYWRRQPA